MRSLPLRRPGPSRFQSYPGQQNQVTKRLSTDEVSRNNNHIIIFREPCGVQHIETSKKKPNSARKKKFHDHGT